MQKVKINQKKVVVKNNKKRKYKKDENIYVKAVKRVYNNLVFKYARYAITFGIPIVTFLYGLYIADKKMTQANRDLGFQIAAIRELENVHRIGGRIDMLEQNINPLNARRVDTQNVHDNQVNTQSREIYNRYSIPRNETVYNALKNMKHEFRNDKTILNVINLIEKRNVIHLLIAGLNRTELQCLATVYNEVASNEDKKNYFAQMLRDCVGNFDGGLVCPIGVVNRIVVALVIDNPDVIPRNFKRELQNELQNLAIRVRNNVLNNNNLLTDDQKTNEFQSELRREAYANYSANNNITKAHLDEILEPLLEACC